MLYYINHFFQIWVLPPGINLLSGLIGFAVLRFRPSLAKSLLLFSLLSLWLFSLPMIAQKLVDGLQYQYPVLMNENIKLDGSSALVVLEAGLNYLTPEYGQPVVAATTLQRLRYAAFLNKKYGIPIMVSGNDPIRPAINQADYMANALKDYFNVDTKWKEDKGANTVAEAVYATTILKKENVKKIFLVTEALHMPRAMQAFQGRGIEIIPAPTAFRLASYNLGNLSAYLPTMGALKISTEALHEYVGMLWYRMYAHH